MLKVKFSPVRSDKEPLTASWLEGVLTVNGEPFDLTLLPDGATAVHPVLGNVSRVVDDYEVTLTLPHGPKAPHSTRFPEDVIMTVDDNLTIPAWGEVQ